MVMLDDLPVLKYEKKRGDIVSFVSPDVRLAAEFSGDVPSTTLTPPPNKQQRIRGRSQGSSSGNGKDATTGEIKPSVITGTTGNDNPASVA
eukprot:15086386-Heterocapsa_arctica.AAC.1